MGVEHFWVGGWMIWGFGGFGGIDTIGWEGDSPISRREHAMYIPITLCLFECHYLSVKNSYPVLSHLTSTLGRD